MYCSSDVIGLIDIFNLLCVWFFGGACIRHYALLWQPFVGPLCHRCRSCNRECRVSDQRCWVFRTICVTEVDRFRNYGRALSISLIVAGLFTMCLSLHSMELEQWGVDRHHKEIFMKLYMPYHQVASIDCVHHLNAHSVWAIQPEVWRGSVVVMHRLAQAYM